MSIKDRFKPTKLENFQKEMDKGNQFINNQNNSQERADKVEVNKFDDGTHKFRILPAHEDTKSFAIPFVTVWVPAYTYDRDENGKVKQDKEGNYVKKKSKKPVFNARQHGSANRDIVEEYVKIAKEQLDNETDDQVKQQKLDKLNHFKDGLIYKPDYVMYACEVKKGEKSEPFVLQVTNGQMKKINKVAAMQDEDDEALETDPFTDPEIGRCLILQKDSNAQNNSDKYIFSIDTAIDKASQKVKLYPLTEEELEKFDQFESLEERFGSSVYTKRDFSIALEGLQMYDEDNGFGVVQLQEFQEIAEELESQLPDQPSQDDSEQQDNGNTQNESNDQFVTPTSINNSDEDEEEEDDEEEDEEEPTEGDQFDAMDRASLKAFIKKNGYSIKVSKKWSDEHIRQRIREEQQNDDLPWKDQEPNEKEVSDQSNKDIEEDQSEKDMSELTVQQKLAKFKNRNKNG